MLGTNYYGSLAMTQEILPLIRSGGRLVNVCSMDETLEIYSVPLREAFISASKTSVAACSALIEKFTYDVKAKKEIQEGWPPTAYAISKVGEITVIKVIAMEEKKPGRKRNVLVNSCYPGFVNIDMMKGKGVKTIDKGAKTQVLLALGDIGGSLGEF
jgi:carbonyl reductase 1